MHTDPNVIDNIEKPKTDSDVIYIITVHGFEPEFHDGLAFRYDNIRRKERKKAVVCPHCTGEFATVNEKTKIEVYRCSGKDKPKHHKTKPCKICYKLVGIRYA